MMICGKPMRAYELNRPRKYDWGTQAVCGRRPGHNGQCLTEDVMEQARIRMREHRILLSLAA
jgi:hypothetical protein